MTNLPVSDSSVYLDFWSEYTKQPIDWANMLPKDRSDFRERVRRETVKGKLTFFHENIENYLLRQTKACTTFRVFSWWTFFSLLAMKHTLVFFHYFPGMIKYGFLNHPNYKKLGHGWSWFYLLRVPFMIWISWRVTRMLYSTAVNTWNGKEDRLNQLQNDWMYDDWFRDSEDSRYVNFRYSDHYDRIPQFSHHSHMIYKPAADKVKSALRFYRNGNDNFFDRLFNPLN